MYRISTPLLFASLFAVSASLPSHAENPGASHSFVREATKYCVGNIGRPDLVEGALKNAGFSLTPGMDAGTFEARAPGVYAFIDVSSSRTYCTIQSQEVTLEQARKIGTSVIQLLFPAAESAGPGPCDGQTVAGLRPPLRISYAQAGNSGECIDDGTSAILIQ